MKRERDSYVRDYIVKEKEEALIMVNNRIKFIYLLNNSQKEKIYALLEMVMVKVYDVDNKLQKNDPFHGDKDNPEFQFTSYGLNYKPIKVKEEESVEELPKEKKQVPKKRKKREQLETIEYYLFTKST